MKRPRRLLVRDTLLAVPAAVIAVMAAVGDDWSARPDNRTLPVAIFVVAAAVLAFRRTAPMHVWVASLVLAGVSAPVVLRAAPSQVVLSFALYTVLSTSDRITPLRGALVSYAVALAGTVALDVQLAHGLRVDTFLMPALSIAYGAGLGAVVRVNRRTAADLAERNAELIALNEVARREAVLAERARIAREVHDIVAHHLSGIVLHARAARDATDRNGGGDAARDALDVIAESGAEALASTRGLLSMLRDGDLDTAPQPGTDGIPDLVASMAARGLPTELVVHGEPVRMPADVQLSAYRIVQEALTNASRHAHAQRSLVTLSWEEPGLRIVVDDNGVGTTPGYREGHGLVGIRERAALVGGSATVGSSPWGGWRLEAVLPYADVPVARPVEISR